MRLDWLWFCGYDLDDSLPHHSVISKARRRWGVQTFETLFEQVGGIRVAQRMQAHGLGDPGLVDRLLKEARELARGQWSARVAAGVRAQGSKAA